MQLNSWAHKVPVENSTEIINIGFTGKHKSYTDADTWYPSWASDGNMYSPWTDGSIEKEKCRSYPGKKARTGQAKIEGDDPLNLKITSLGTTKGTALPYGGRYPAGSLVYNTWSFCRVQNFKRLWKNLGNLSSFTIKQPI